MLGANFNDGIVAGICKISFSVSSQLFRLFHSSLVVNIIFITACLWLKWVKILVSTADSFQANVEQRMTRFLHACTYAHVTSSANIIKSQVFEEKATRSYSSTQVHQLTTKHSPQTTLQSNTWDLCGYMQSESENCYWLSTVQVHYPLCPWKKEASIFFTIILANT